MLGVVQAAGDGSDSGRCAEGVGEGAAVGRQTGLIAQQVISILDCVAVSRTIGRSTGFKQRDPAHRIVVEQIAGDGRPGAGVASVLRGLASFVIGESPAPRCRFIVVVSDGWCPIGISESSV